MQCLDSAFSTSSFLECCIKCLVHVILLVLDSFKGGWHFGQTKC